MYRRLYKLYIYINTVKYRKETIVKNKSKNWCQRKKCPEKYIASDYR